MDEGNLPPKELSERGDGPLLLSLAERHLEDEDYVEAIRVGKQAHDLLEEVYDLHRMVDASRLIINAHCGLEDRGTANQLATDMLDHVRNKGGGENLQAKMFLSIAEVNYDKRGSKNRERAMQAAAKALAILEDHKDVKTEADVCLLLCNITIKGKKGPKEEYGQRALSYGKRALDLYRTIKDHKQEALSWHNMAAAFIAMRDLELGLKASKEALRLFRKVGDKKLEAFELHCAALWQSERQPEAAVVVAEEALVVARELDGKGGRAFEATILSTLVRLQSGLADPAVAVRVARDGLRRFRQLEDKEGEAQALIAIALANQDHDPHEALMAAKRSQSAFKALGDVSADRAIQRMTSELYIRVQQGEKSFESAMLSLSAADANDKREIASSMFAVARVLLAKGAFDQVLSYAQQASDLCKTVKWIQGEAESLALRCRALAAMERLDEAFQAANEAKELVRLGGDKAAEARLMLLSCEILLLKKDFEAGLQTAIGLKDLACDLKDIMMQVQALLLASRASVKSLQCRAEENPGCIHANDEGFDTAHRHSYEALALARCVADRELVASAQCMMAEIFLLIRDPEAALGATIEATMLYHKAGDLHGEALALLLSGQAYCDLKEMDEAWEAAARSADLHRQAGNIVGAAKAAEFLEMIRPHWANKEPQAPTTEKYEVLDALKDAKEPQSQLPMAPQKGIKKALGKRQAVDLSMGVSQEMIKERLISVIEDNLGLDPEDFEDDVPVMEAGVTSNGALMLQSALSQDFPISKLPATLFFDYPSIGQASEFILNTLQ